MALRHTRLTSKVFPSRLRVLSHTSKRYQTEGSSGGAPYRPWPAAKYQHPETADYWSANGYRPQSEKDDEYPDEKVYLSEIEERLRTYDRKYCDSDRVKALYNEFGWDDIDDRATHTYGDVTWVGEQIGKGKKIDPSHYVTPEWTNVDRKPIPPVQYMTAEQVRRARGSLATVREMPPETESIWKYWNGYSALGVFTATMVTKELYVMGGHDFFEAIATFGTFGVAAAIAADWYAWWHTLLMQEGYDRQYFPLLTAVKKYNAQLETINSKPNEKKLMFQMQKYREMIAEKVLSKTLSNRLGRIVESTVAKLESKVNEEAMTKKEAENAWRRSALQQTLEYFEQDSVRNDFMSQALQQFCAGDTAKISNQAATIGYETNVFDEQYKSNYERSRNEYLSEQRGKGTLSPVFVDASERQFKSAQEKAQEYEQKVQDWASSHNPVNAPTPAFS
eukprot:CAMPEP_0197028190 /NCGR_PEP_ID=MMETSP1384-20130603/7935_1 /TAXON_ID=29189 /ORGANISM="Ammonia sp." /LENGTH=448 /DNA_ID=CAMNT_0042457155 /DNA_START=20 /DNA_END=1366 /DNA_ORIENTATION=-